MKKFIIFICTVIAFSLLVGQSLHRIERPTKIIGWLNVQGDIWPIFDAKYDLGKRNYWWDSIFCEDGQYRYVLIWSADSTDTCSISPTKLVIDSIIANYYGGASGGNFDSLYVLWGTTWETQAWLKGTDTIRLDTTSYASLSQVGDSSNAVRGDTRDTINAWWTDTSAVYAHLSQIRDSIDSWWSDTSAVYAHLSQLRDSVNAWWGDTSAVYAHLSQIRDSVNAWWGDSSSNYTTISMLNDTTAELRSNMPDTADAKIAILKSAAQTITGAWEFDALTGVIDGNKFFVTDDAEDDTLFFQIVNDTARIWVSSGLAFVVGEEGKTLFDSVELGGGATLIKWVQVGNRLAFIENDFDTTYATQNIIVWDFLSSMDGASWTVSSGTAGAGKYFNFHGATSDTIIGDSLKIWYRTAENDVYIDSIGIEEGYKLDGSSTTLVWSDGTNLGEGNTSEASHTYTDMNAKMAWDWRTKFELSVETSGTAGNAYVYKAQLYAHYQQ